MIEATVVKRFRIPGTIDGHDAIGITLRVTGGNENFRITFVTVNWGRGYKPGEFRRNVEAVFDKVDEKQYVVLLIQELDEDDPAEEHDIVEGMVPKGSTLVKWETREPIVVWPEVKVIRKRKRMTMDQGTRIGAPEGTGPRRFFVSCVLNLHGVLIGVGNQHPHRYSLTNPKVVEARHQGEVVSRREVELLAWFCDVVVWGGDVNTRRYPKLHPKEKIAYRRDLDTLRLINLDNS